MDSRGCYDAITRNESAGLGMKHAKSAVEIQAIRQATAEGCMCYPTWVPSDLNLADAMTKYSPEACKVMALYLARKSWIVRFDPEFVSARKRQKLRRAQEQGRINMPGESHADDLEEYERSYFGLEGKKDFLWS